MRDVIDFLRRNDSGADFVFETCIDGYKRLCKEVATAGEDARSCE